MPLVKEVEERTEASPAKALADAGFYSNQNVRELTQKRVASTYMCPTEPGAGAEHGQAGAYDWAQPGAQSGTESHAEEIAQPGGTASVRTAQDAGGTGVWRAQATAWDAQFRTRGPAKVATEFTLVALAYNLTRPFVRRPGHWKVDEPGKPERSKKRNRAHATTNQFSRTHFERCPTQNQSFSARAESCPPEFGAYREFEQPTGA